MTKNAHKNSKGYALLELLFYISFFAAISIAVISSLLTMVGAFRETSLYAGLSQSGAMIERISREIRQAESVSLAGGGNLMLNTLDEEGNPKTVQFLLSGTDIELRENGNLTGNLNGGNIAVDSLDFTSLTTEGGTGVKLQISIHAKNDPQNRTYDLLNTIVLRGNY